MRSSPSSPSRSPRPRSSPSPDRWSVAAIPTRAIPVAKSATAARSRPRPHRARPPTAIGLATSVPPPRPSRRRRTAGSQRRQEDEGAVAVGAALRQDDRDRGLRPHRRRRIQPARQRSRQHRQEPADRSGRRAGPESRSSQGRCGSARAGAAGRPGRARPTTLARAGKSNDGDARPVGESHFESKQPMTVDRGSSAMVSMVRDTTEGEVVYLYDAESERGNNRFAFRAVRFKNPTDSTSRPVRSPVYGREPLHRRGPSPSRSHRMPPAVVPFALDRQTRRGAQRRRGRQDRASAHAPARHLTAEVQHVRRRKLTITNRLAQPAKVFIRHTVNKGWTRARCAAGLRAGRRGAPVRGRFSRRAGPRRS